MPDSVSKRSSIPIYRINDIDPKVVIPWAVDLLEITESRFTRISTYLTLPTLGPPHNITSTPLRCCWHLHYSVTIRITGSGSTIAYNAAASDVRGEGREGHWVHNAWPHVTYARETTSRRYGGGGGLGGCGVQADEHSEGGEGEAHLSVGLSDGQLHRSSTFL